MKTLAIGVVVTGGALLGLRRVMCHERKRYAASAEGAAS
jgi:hypothetical protein